MIHLINYDPKTMEKKHLATENRGYKTAQIQRF
jgi:hypothetical protein